QLQHCPFDAGWALAEQDERAGNAFGAATWARRALDFAPMDETALCRLLQLLDRLGDGAGALAAYAEFAKRLEREYEITTSSSTRELVAAIRNNMNAPAR